MAMPVDINTFNIPAGQKALLQAYHDLGVQLSEVERSRGERPVPTAQQTAKQARNVDRAIRELNTFLGLAQRGAQYVFEYHKKANEDAFVANADAP
jgi:hypothetical protein